MDSRVNHTPLLHQNETSWAGYFPRPAAKLEHPYEQNLYGYNLMRKNSL